MMGRRGLGERCCKAERSGVDDDGVDDSDSGKTVVMPVQVG